jgi:hypothetical protein
MGKKYIAIFLVFFVIIGSFAACKKANKGIVITGSDGKTRVLATNNAGETLTDNAGNLILVVTDAKGDVSKDSNGNAETQKVAPPEYYLINNSVECSKFSVVIPDGWQQSRADNIRLIQIKTGGELDLMVKAGSTVDDVMYSSQTFMDSAKKQDPKAEFGTTTANICGVKATKYHYKSTKFAAQINLYVFEKSGIVYLFESVIKNEYISSVDFEKVMNTVKFK